MNSTCMDLEIYGNCTRGEACDLCNASKTKLEIKLNTNAKNYIPKSKRDTILIPDKDEKIKFNFKAAEYIPKSQRIKSDEELDDECIEEFDMIMKDIINNELMEEMGEEESDEERWFPNYKSCGCCKGFVYKCKGAACVSLGLCYCKMWQDCEDEEQ
jgi:hypothetical protein